MEADFFLAAVKGALGNYGKAEIFNTGQNVQFAAMKFTGLLKTSEIAISTTSSGPGADCFSVPRSLDAGAATVLQGLVAAET